MREKPHEAGINGSMREAVCAFFECEMRQLARVDAQRELLWSLLRVSASELQCPRCDNAAAHVGPFVYDLSGSDVNNMTVYNASDRSAVLSEGVYSTIARSVRRSRTRALSDQ